MYGLDSWTRIDPELVHEHLATALVGTQALSQVAGALVGAEELRVQPFARCVIGKAALADVGGVGMAALLNQTVGQLLAERQLEVPDQLAWTDGPFGVRVVLAEHAAVPC